MSDVWTSNSPGPVNVDRYTTDDTDSLSYDNGALRYDYDLAKGGPHEDVSGRAGVGYTTETTDVYVSAHADEGTGNTGGRLDLEHAISPNLVLDAHISADSEDNVDHHIGLNHDISENEAWRIEAGENAVEGEYLDGRYENASENGFDSVHFHGSEKGGSSVEYTGRRSGEDWNVDGSVRVSDEGDIEGQLSGEKRFELNEDTDGKVYGDASSDGSWRAGAEAVHRASEDESLTLGIEFDNQGNTDMEALHSYLGNSERLNVKIDAEGNETIAYNGHHEGERWSTNESLSVDADGKVDGQISGAYNHEVSDSLNATSEATLRANGTWDVGLYVDKELSENANTNHVLRYDSTGKLSGEHSVVVTSADGRAFAGGAVGWDTEGGRHAETSLGYEFESGASADGRLAWDGKDLSGSAGASAKIHENTNVEAGFNFDNGTGTTGGNVGVRFEAPNSNTAVGLGAGFTSSRTMESASLNGDLAFADFHGDGSAASVGLVAEEDVFKRRTAESKNAAVHALREAALKDAPEGTQFVEYGARRKLGAEFGASIPLGYGYVETGLSVGEEYELRFVKRTDDARLNETPTEAELTAPTNAKAVLGMKVGESFSITGGSHQGVRGGGGLGFSMGAVGISGGVDAGLLVSGRMTTEVVRGSAGSARLILSKADGKTVDGGLKVSVGLSPEKLVGLPAIPDSDPKGPILGVFFGLLMSIIGRFFSFGGRFGAEGSDGDSRVVDASLDLSRPDVQRAYDLALKGDWSQIEKMARDGHPGVDMDRSIFTDVTQKSIPLALNFFGFFFNRDSAETKKDSNVITDDGAFDVESDLDSNTQSTGGIFRNTKFTVSDFTRDVSLVTGKMGDVKAQEHWLTWKREHKDTFSSREEVSSQLNLARLLADPAMGAHIDQYRAKIAGIAERKKLWIGPRNEMRRTTVSTSVVVSDAGLDELTNLKLDTLWTAYAQNWPALNPGKALPMWLSKQGRAELHKQQNDLDILLEQAEMIGIEKTLQKLVVAAATPGEEKRHDALRKTIFSDMADESLVAAVAILAGREHVQIKLDVDSAAGDSGSQYDLHVGRSGADFDVQREVFGQAI